jgi:hypothetical protein
MPSTWAAASCRFRRDVAYVAAEEASILPLLEQFDFVEDRQRWGYKFRFGLFDISDHDMRLIARAMQMTPSSRSFWIRRQQGVGERLTACARSFRPIEASSCNNSRIRTSFLSIQPNY